MKKKKQTVCCEKNSSAVFLLPNDSFLTVLHPVFVSFWPFQNTLGENIPREVSHYPLL